MSHVVAGMMQKIEEALDPSYRVKKQEVVTTLRQMEIISTALLIASTASIIMDIGSSGVSNGLSGIGIGIVKNFVNLPLCYLAYNSTQVLSNLSEFIDNPRKCMVLSGVIPVYSKQKVKDHFQKNTFCFDLPIKLMTDDLLEKLPSV